MFLFRALDLLKLAFKTIKETQVLNPEVTSGYSHDDPKPLDESQPKIQTKRNWRAEFRELFCDHLLSLDEYDGKGLSEKLGLSWLTRGAARRRRSCESCWGPYGLFFTRHESGEVFYAACLLDFGCTLVAFAFIFVCMRPNLWFLAFTALVAGVVLISLNMPKVKVWGADWENSIEILDIDCEIVHNSPTLSKSYEDYKEFCKSFQVNPKWKLLEKYRPLSLDLELFSEDLCARRTSPEYYLESEAPEAPSEHRTKKLNKIACLLAEMALGKTVWGRKPTRDDLSRTGKRPSERFEWAYFFFGVDPAVEFNGQTEIVSSFAFASKRGLKFRRISDDYYGPFCLLRRFNISPGNATREGRVRRRADRFVNWTTIFAIGTWKCWPTLFTEPPLWLALAFLLSVFFLVGFVSSLRSLDDFYEGDLNMEDDLNMESMEEVSDDELIPAFLPRRRVQDPKLYRTFREKATKTSKVGYLLYALFFVMLV